MRSFAQKIVQYEALMLQENYTMGPKASQQCCSSWDPAPQQSPARWPADKPSLRAVLLTVQ